MSDTVTDQQAETALLTLGAALQWRPMQPGFEPPPGFLWEAATVRDGDRHQNYSVSRHPAAHGDQGVVEVTFWKKNRGDKKRNDQEKRRHFPTYADAKAACERHAATGEWSGDVMPLWVQEPTYRAHGDRGGQYE